ncbi:GntR family transcriptional regulator [Acrocarpospora catenulata]|uniref:GntR family transcriptional regulator n=1 Tax=Acrocarpospora catenulata TaxID=2836182 RepID=UPI001BD92B43|nr:GntR family transcriptional regulator [Acrocarpospora catenulata]
MSIGESHRALRDEVADQLRSWILDGTLAPGSRLGEGAISERLGVSRLPVREAFRRLEAEGLVQTAPRRGVRVAVFDQEELATIQEIRLALELIAVRKTAERRDSETMNELERVLLAGSQAAEAGDQSALKRLNGDFHELLAGGTGSRVLVALLRSVRNQAHHLVGGLVTSPEDSWSEHARVIRAVLEADAEMAALLMRRHLHDRHESQRATLTPNP